MLDPVAQAGMRLAGIDILRIPLDEAIPLVYVYLLRNLDKEEREDMHYELDKPLPKTEADGRTQDEMEDDELLRILGIPGLRRKPSTPAIEAASVVD